jgi:hypothetical protein
VGFSHRKGAASAPGRQSYGAGREDSNAHVGVGGESYERVISWKSFALLHNCSQFDQFAISHNVQGDAVVLTGRCIVMSVVNFTGVQHLSVVD